MYVVLEGGVKLTKGDRVIAELGKGQHFGEMALIDRSVRSATAITTVKSRFVCIQRKEFFDLIKREPPLAVKLLWSFVQVLGTRLRKTTDDLGQALHGENNAGEATEKENQSQD
jgi:CRP-like cAMP-binding protein